MLVICLLCNKPFYDLFDHSCKRKNMDVDYRCYYCGIVLSADDMMYHDKIDCMLQKEEVDL